MPVMLNEIKSNGSLHILPSWNQEKSQKSRRITQARKFWSNLWFPWLSLLLHFTLILLHRTKMIKISNNGKMVYLRISRKNKFYVMRIHWVYLHNLTVCSRIMGFD